jgi:hypothetical protein
MEMTVAANWQRTRSNPNVTTTDTSRASQRVARGAHLVVHEEDEHGRGGERELHVASKRDLAPHSLEQQPLDAEEGETHDHGQCEGKDWCHEIDRHL